MSLRGSTEAARGPRLPAGGTAPLLALGLLLAAAGLTGCTSHVLAKLATDAPNRTSPSRVVRDPQFAELMRRTYAESWTVAVGPPSARLNVGVLEPGYYGFRYGERRVMTDGKAALRFEMTWVAPDRTDWGVVWPEPVATIVLLHGYRDAKENVLHWGLYLAERGYRCVLVDLRGHGTSTGDRIGFGSFEAADVAQVLDNLYQRGLARGKVGVLGVSYGASTALLLASRDERVGAVVSLEPFSDGAKAVVEFAHGVAPKRAAKIGTATFASAVERAARRGGFKWADTSVLAAMERVRQPVLFFHGAQDSWLSPEHSRLLHAKAPAGSRLVILSEDNHLTLASRLAPMGREVDRWFRQHLKPAETTVASLAPPP